MIGGVYNFILSSRPGSKFFRVDTSASPVEWSEKGVKRFIFWNLIFYWICFLSPFIYFGGFRWRFLLSVILLSLYSKEKLAPVFLALFEELDGIEVTDRSKPLEETYKFKVVTSIFKGEDWNNALRKHRE